MQLNKFRKVNDQTKDTSITFEISHHQRYFGMYSQKRADVKLVPQELQVDRKKFEIRVAFRRNARRFLYIRLPAYCSYGTEYEVSIVSGLRSISAMLKRPDSYRVTGSRSARRKRRSIVAKMHGLNYLYHQLKPLCIHVRKQFFRIIFFLYRLPHT